MGAWETDDEIGSPALPALMRPMDLKGQRNSRTPSRGSRRSRRSVTPPGRISASPPPIPGSDKTDKSDRVSRDLATDEKISILDPRRFTPTLHANLVGEILSLKRDQEEKLKVIENLESTLQSTREEEDSIQTTLQTTARENRSLKRQLALLEGGTSSALGELARERDEAVEIVTETKRRLETTQKKLKTQEEKADSTQEQWDNEVKQWEEERRKTDRKVHVLETRLKAVLEEMAAFQSAAIEGQVMAGDDEGQDSDGGSIRSMAVRDSLRYSLAQKTNGHSLADELNFDDDSDGQTEPSGRDSAMSTYRLMRADSRASVRSRTHRRHQSGESLIRPGSVIHGRFQPHTIQEDEEAQRPVTPKVSYTDTGVQFSPPPSPKLAPTSQGPSHEPQGVANLAAKWERHYEEVGTEANSRRKRVSVAKPLPVIQTAPPGPQKLMVSAEAQTTDVPLSPPKTPRSPPLEGPEQPPTSKTAHVAVMVSAGTQTELPPASSRPVTPQDATLGIPSIAIHPPSSRPSSPKVSRLPQLQKDFGCQVSLSYDLPMTSSGMQTDEIRIDQRLDRLPLHLHPSAVRSRPTTPADAQNGPDDPELGFSPVPGNVPPPRNPRRLASLKSIESITRGSMDMETSQANGEVENPVSRKSRVSSQFSGNHDASSADELDDFGHDADQSDSEFRTALSAPRAVKSPEPGRSTPPGSPEDLKRKGECAASPLGTTSVYNSFRLSVGTTATPKRKSSTKLALQPSAMTSSKAGGMRKAAMIQNGISTHQEEGPEADPPFPIPTRASSRHPLFTEGMRMPSGRNPSPKRTEPWHRKGNRTSGTYRTNSIRKSRSAAAMPYGQNRNSRRKDSRSPPDSPEVPSTPTVPPLPSNAKQLATPSNSDRLFRRGHRHQNSGTTATTDATAFTGARSNDSSNAKGVVDAIAQTMVGEWMHKYVRRRKSFTAMTTADNSGRDDSSNDRHKRWVWLAPYERAILWSSKQPSSGSALLGGKSGRKLTIQSVLDVKDDNPPPKGCSPQAVFNRSILILTPQRALKFTAVNADRHYLWLTALSFLAHSQQDIPEMPTPGSQQQQAPPEFESPPPGPLAPPGKFTRTRKPRIRDSIRLAKSQSPNLNNHNQAQAQPAQPQPQAPFRPIGGIANTMSSQGTLHGGSNGPLSDRTISPMPSIPDVPMSLLPAYRSVSAAATSETAVSNHSRPSYSNSKSSHNYAETNDTSKHERDESLDAAIPPAIPRFSRDPLPPAHGRKRSNTGGAAGGGRIPPPLSFRGLGPQATSNHGPTYSGSTNTTWSNEPSNSNGPRTVTDGGWGSSVTGRASEEAETASYRGSVNLFEAIGTMRMEAFISPFSRYESENYPDPLEESRQGRVRQTRKQIRRKQSRSRSRSRSRTRDGFQRGGLSAWREEYRAGERERRGVNVHERNGYRTAGEEEWTGRRSNPFEGF